MDDAKKTLDILRKDYFNSIINPVKKIYVDLEMLLDFKMAAILKLVKSKDDMEYVYKMIPEYNMRLDLDTAQHFKRFGKTDEELLASVDDATLGLAQWTSAGYDFEVILSYIGMNTKATTGKDTKISVVVNCSDVKYPKVMFDNLAGFLMSRHPSFVFSLENSKRYDNTSDYYLDFDMFFLYDHEKFLQNESILDSFTNKGTYMTKSIYTPPVVNKTLGLDESEYSKALVSTSAALNLFCDFYYMRSNIVIDNKTIR